MKQNNCTELLGCSFLLKFTVTMTPQTPQTPHLDFSRSSQISWRESVLFGLLDRAKGARYVEAQDDQSLRCLYLAWGARVHSHRPWTLCIQAHTRDSIGLKYRKRISDSLVLFGYLSVSKVYFLTANWCLEMCSNTAFDHFRNFEMSTKFGTLAPLFYVERLRNTRNVQNYLNTCYC